MCRGRHYQHALYFTDKGAQYASHNLKICFYIDRLLLLCQFLFKFEMKPFKYFNHLRLVQVQDYGFLSIRSMGNSPAIYRP